MIGAPPPRTAGQPGARGADRVERLTRDGRLRLRVEEAVAPRVAAWLPHSLDVLRGDGPATGTAAATIVVRAAPGPVAPPRQPGAPQLTFLGASLWRRAAHDMVMAADTGGAGGRIDLAHGCATLRVGAADAGTTTALHGMLTLAAAYLLGRAGRALAHAASLVAPDGRAWLLVGDTHAGKSTTCATLLDGGWGFCADDHTIVGPSTEGGLVVEGWPRTLHLDRGWADGVPAGGARDDVDALARWPGAWRASAPLAGVLFPRVEAGHATALEPLAASERFARLVRQCPWLLAEPVAAPALVALLRRTAALPGAALRLGRDAFHRAGPLVEALAPLLDEGPPPDR